ncbi:MAG: AAA-like domain-containing protein [Mastigocoleus sp.]
MSEKQNEEIPIAEIIEKINLNLHPNILNQLQEIILIQSWNGQTYEDIANFSDYSIQYIRDIGYLLWQLLSEFTSTKVTKNNVKFVLSKWWKNLYLYDYTNKAYFSKCLKLPDGSINLNSPLYIKRSPVEDYCYSEITLSGALVIIRAPMKMGKTSLTIRILDYASSLKYRTIYLNLEQAEFSIIKNLDRLLRWFCINISRQLKLKPLLDDYWDEDIGSKISCTNYFQDYILRQIKVPIVLGIDEINWIFEYPIVAKDFLSLLRFWHEEANKREIWQNLRIVMVYSTEVSVPLNFNQSLFNVGLSIRLPELNQKQIRTLASVYQVDNLTDEEVTQISDMLGGHPYLVQLILYYLHRQENNLEYLLQTAPTQKGIYSNYLWKYLVTLKAYPELAEAMKKVVTNSRSVYLESVLAYKLESMGLVSILGNEVRPKCKLYYMYFQIYLQN